MISPLPQKLTEIMLLTNIAVLHQRANKTLEYDSVNMKSQIILRPTVCSIMNIEVAGVCKHK